MSDNWGQKEWFQDKLRWFESTTDMLHELPELFPTVLSSVVSDCYIMAKSAIAVLKATQATAGTFIGSWTLVSLAKKIERKTVYCRKCL